MRVKHLSAAVAIALGLLIDCAGFSRAELITFDITGSVDSVDDPSGILGGAVSAGDPLRGNYRFLSGARDSNPDPTVGDYYQRSFAAGIALSVGALDIASAQPPDIQIGIRVSSKQSSYLLYSFSQEALSSVASVDLIRIELFDSTGTAYGNDSLPATPPDLARFDSQLSFVEGHLGEGDDERPFQIALRVDAIRLASAMAVPEPSVAVLACAGGLATLGLAWVRRRRSRRGGSGAD